MYRWAKTVLVPTDRKYARVSQKLAAYAPWFDGCIGAIDGTHIKVEVNYEAKADFFNRKGETAINVCASWIWMVVSHTWGPGRRGHVMTWRC